jgi:DNA-binding CsgD family transcriptional regulator
VSAGTGSSSGSPDSHPLGEEALTDREREVRDLMLQRLTDPEIAARLGLSPRTVEQHAREVRRKLGLRRRREPVPLALSVPGP